MNAISVVVEMFSSEAIGVLAERAITALRAPRMNLWTLITYSH